MKRSRIKGLLIDLDESARIAAEQLREHKVRSLLTALGVIIGVWAVVLIGLGINGLDSVFQNSLKILGSDHYYVQKFPWRDPGDKIREYVNRRDIKESYADEINDAIAESPESLLQLAVPVYRFRRSISRDDISVSDIEVSASRAEYAYITTASIAHGRFFTKDEEMGGQKLVILGSGLASALFPEEDNLGNAVGKEIKIDRIDFRVIAVLEQQGSFLGVGDNDTSAFLPLPVARRYFISQRRFSGATIYAAKKPESDFEEAREELQGIMRRARGLDALEDNDFEINASDAVENSLGPVKAGVALAGFVITGLALFVGAIGIMNITFVSVKERTKEIGTRRAIGARRSSILTQFLMEAVSICVLGGLVGLAFAVLSKMLIGVVVPDFPANFSVNLMILAVTLSVLTGILSGFIPAWVASRMPPANALRHE